MEIKIEVGEERFREVLEKELGAFTQEELHAICREALVKQLSDPAVFRELFVEKHGNKYDYSERYYASDVLKTAARQVSFEETFKEMQDGIVSYIKEHHGEILRDIVTSMFIGGLSNAVSYSATFQQRLSEELYNREMMRQNQD